MKIQNLWFLCITVRLLLICAIFNLAKTKIKHLLSLLLFIIGTGFLYKGLFGSNNEKQIAKVFWHETRYIHSLFYLSACFYLYNNKINMTVILLSMDIIFSFFYRIYTNQ